MLSDRHFEQIRTIAYRHAGLSIPDVKKYMVVRRLTPRLRVLGIETFAAYCNLISSEAGRHEITEFVNALTTNKTSFFREPEQFDHLRTQVLPAILRRRVATGDRNVRIWSAGCSTGEEAWSIALTAASVPRLLDQCDVRILASDVDSNVVARAQMAAYRYREIEHLSHAQRSWFVPQPGSEDVVVRDELRRLVKFRHFNLHDPWPRMPPIDVVFCRNTFIYFDKPSKVRLAERFAGVLRPGGVFYAGHSECLNTVTRCFSPSGHSIYVRPE